MSAPLAIDPAGAVPTRSRHIVIIGGGAAARAFVEAHLRSGLADTIEIFGEEPHPIYNRVLLPHFISGHNTFASMVTATAEELGARQVRFTPGVRIASIDRAGKAVVDAAGGRHPYDVLILATGSRPARHYQGPLPKSGVYGLRKRSDAEAIQSEAGPGRRAIVVGGGVLGLELADALVHIGTDVVILQRSERLMGKQLDAKGAGYLADAMRELGVVIRFKTDIDELIGEQRITGVKLKGGEILPCDVLIFATGTVPNAELARVATLTCSTGVTVDGQLRTSDPHIYAMGEVAEYRSQAAGTTAAAEVQACHLSEVLCGRHDVPCPAPVNSNILKVHGVQLANVGHTEDGPGLRAVVFEDASSGIYQKCVVKDGRLVGVLLFGDTALFAEYRDLVANGTVLGDKRAGLLRPTGAAKPVEGRLICSCNQVGQITIERVIGEERAKGACELKAVCAATRAGTSCGSCRPEVQKLINAVGVKG